MIVCVCDVVVALHVVIRPVNYCFICSAVYSTANTVCCDFPLWLLQFNRFDPEDGRIMERDFARMILSYADINSQQKKKFMKRIKRVYGHGKVRVRLNPASQLNCLSGSVGRLLAYVYIRNLVIISV